MKLGESGGTADMRTFEARRILFDMGLKDRQLDLDHENDFVQKLVGNFARFGSRTIVSPNQLFWLRDLKEKYLL